VVKSERRFISDGRRKNILLEGTQAMSACPSDKDRMGMKTLGWWVVGGESLRQRRQNLVL
jgi:hypothetical protein